MDAGKLDRRVTLQRQGDPVDDGFTTTPGDWATLATVWAQLLILPRPIREAIAAGEYSSNVPVNFRIRKDSAWADLNAKDRLLYNAEPHNITAVREDGRAYLIIDAIARGDD